MTHVHRVIAAPAARVGPPLEHDDGPACPFAHLFAAEGPPAGQAPRIGAPGRTPPAAPAAEPLPPCTGALAKPPSLGAPLWAPARAAAQPVAPAARGASWLAATLGGTLASAVVLLGASEVGMTSGAPAVAMMGLGALGMARMRARLEPGAAQQLMGLQPECLVAGLAAGLVRRGGGTGLLPALLGLAMGHGARAARTAPPAHAAPSAS